MRTQPQRATCEERAAFAEALLVAAQKISRAGGLVPDATTPKEGSGDPTSRRVQRPGAGKLSASADQHPDAASGDDTREAASASTASTTPPSPGVVTLPASNSKHSSLLPDASSPVLSDTGSMGKAARPRECVPVAAPTSRLVTLCSGCGDIQDNGVFRPLADFEGEMLRTDLGIGISHALCPQCMTDYRTKLAMTTT